MALNITEKILREHRVAGRMKTGSELAIRIDQALTQDATGTMAMLQFEAMRLDKVRCDPAVSYVDHNTVQVGPENADDHRYLRTAAAHYGLVFSKPGNGICHQLHLERFAEPGKTLLGADSHTPTAGGMGMLAIGAGGLDVAVAMGGGPFYLTMPQVVRVELSGRLRPWVSAKDVILKVLELLSTKGNVGVILEYGGPGIRSLEVPDRATITNMGAECGVTTSVFPSDAKTRRFLEAVGRPDAWHELTADPGADYDRVIELDLATLEPLAAAPHSPGNVVPAASLEGMPVDQVLIGSCTNGSYRDLKTAARILKGRRVDAAVECGVAPGSRRVLAALTREGVLGDLLDAGVRLLENACGFCIGNSMSPRADAVSLRTSNRNFEGRSGTPSAQVYLVSPEVAAVAALHGRMCDPRKSDLLPPRIRLPRSLPDDDAMFLFPPPPAERAGVVVERGPSIGAPPKNGPLPEHLDGEVLIKVGDRITTDHIMPAGARLKHRSNVPVYAQYVFEPIDPGFAGRAETVRDAGRHGVIVAGESYGQGSSREHAALCPMYLGVKAVVARSFERIHAANLINFGILPLVAEQPDVIETLAAGDRVRLPELRQRLAADQPLRLVVGDGTLEIPVACCLTDRQRGVLLAGGLLNYTVLRTD